MILYGWILFRMRMSEPDRSQMTVYCEAENM